jgi:5'-nucleotidase
MTIETKRPLILVSNDDGITSPGIRHLVETVKKLGEVVVVAPDSPQSGMGHAITIGNTLRLDRSDIFGEDVLAYQCSGTPADCVKLAKHHVLKERRPDLVVSGINHGSNSSVSILYSGTMSAAIEAAMEGLPAIGFSLCEHGWNADFSHTLPYITQIVNQVLEKGIPENIALNVNFPAKADGEIKGIKICRQAVAKWQEEFDQRHDPNGRDYFWLTGQFVNLDKGEDTDIFALANGYISVVPSTFDLTAYHAIAAINRSWKVE